MRPGLTALALLAAVLLALGADVVLDARGWKPGTPASRTVQAFAPFQARELVLPEALRAQLERTTLLYYFSPTCPHCQQAMPELLRLAGQLQGEVDVLGVATGHATAADIDDFARTYGVEFPILHDREGTVAGALRATSTPTVLVLRPEGQTVWVTDAYYPWFQGASLFVRMRLHPERSFGNFVEGEYLGVRACAVCHDQEAQGWALSHHAVAYRTLHRRGDSGRAECVGCHVTGLGSPSGFVLGEHGSALSGVGCEACHGPSGPHDGVQTDARAVCTQCHDPEHSVGFSLARGLPHIDHYAANGLSEAELDQRWEALTEGSAARPLLAFHDGPTTGADACQSCHAEEHAAWSASPHGQARRSLKRKQAQETGCLACHATPLAFAAGQAPADFHNEGVGCESCHGPGVEHSRSPRADNILGLGQSCPECVIEGVCTSCHTPKQDPDWALQPGLEAVRGHHGAQAE